MQTGTQVHTYTEALIRTHADTYTEERICIDTYTHVHRCTCTVRNRYMYIHIQRCTNVHTHAQGHAKPILSHVRRFLSLISMEFHGVSLMLQFLPTWRRLRPSLPTFAMKGTYEQDPYFYVVFSRYGWASMRFRRKGQE